MSTKQQGGYQTRFKLDRKKTEKVRKHATECALSVHVRCESVVRSCYQDIQKGELVVILKFFCERYALVLGIHVLHKSSVVVPIAT